MKMGLSPFWHQYVSLKYYRRKPAILRLCGDGRYQRFNMEDSPAHGLQFFLRGRHLRLAPPKTLC